jgi:hypothetical protein
MASLTSPGVSVSIIDESQYTPTQAGSIAYVLIASAQDKMTPSGTVATGTTSANAEKIITVTSQRDLVNYFGTPRFQLDATGNPINGSELNEYGLLAAYSALGVSNQLYVQRADVDTNQLTGTSVRPTGEATDGTYWLDLVNTNFGIYEWGSDDGGFTLQTPAVVVTQATVGGVAQTTTDPSGATSLPAPIQALGNPGDYGVVATSSLNPIWYKNAKNVWTLVGSSAWKASYPTLVGTVSNPSNLVAGTDHLWINNVAVTLSHSTVSGIVSDLGNTIQGVTFAATTSGQLAIYVSDSASSTGNLSNPDGKLSISYAATNDAASKLGLLQSWNGGTNQVANTYTYSSPTVAFGGSNQNPAWMTTDSITRPYGSVWFTTSAAGNGASWAIKEYNATLSTWQLLSAPLYLDSRRAIEGLDPVGGGAGLPVGTVFVKYDTLAATANGAAEPQGTFQPYVKNIAGITSVTGTANVYAQSFTVNNSFLLEVSVPGATTPQSANVTLNGTTGLSLVASIAAAGLPNLRAVIGAGGYLTLSHQAGGTIKITEVTGTPLRTAGITYSAAGPIGNIQKLTSSTFFISPFVALSYFPQTTAPYSNPADGTYWYYSNPLDADIMINDGTAWKGYSTVAADARGFDLTETDTSGVIFSATQPTTQSGGGQLVSGDLWIDTSDLENYPMLYRYNETTSAWTLINKTDNVSSNGILFADARWSYSDSTNPVTDALPSTITMLNSSYVDPDAPDYRLYARGTLLFNTRRSGYGVKQFESTYFSNYPYVAGTYDVTSLGYAPGAYPNQLGTWVSHDGTDPTTGIPYFGHKAQRSVIVTAMKSAIASSTTLREDQTQFNLICAPGYPELIQDMVTLNDDRKNTAFIIGDTPLDLSSDSTTLQNYITNASLAADNGELGLTTHDDYLAVYYPSGLATNLDGHTVVVPPSHMMLRTYIRSDNVSYPWFAPAGVRRGVIDNVSSIGYIDVAAKNVFRTIGVTNGLRDILYSAEVNPITVLPGVGVVAYGQKTRASMTSAMDRVNVARLVCYLRSILGQVASPFIFEPNDTITRNQVQAAFNSVLNDLVAKRGLYDYLVVCDTSNNTPDRIDRNELWVDIAIQPVKAIEFIYIPVRLKNTGAALTVK